MTTDEGKWLRRLSDDLDFESAQGFSLLGTYGNGMARAETKQLPEFPTCIQYTLKRFKGSCFRNRG